MFFSSPPFTLQQLRNAIPKHCFEPSAIRSASYAIRDLFFACLLWFVVAPWIDNLLIGGIVGFLLKALLWTAFAVVQGTILTGEHFCQTTEKNLRFYFVSEKVFGWLLTKPDMARSACRTQ
jgi:hypothetical protein